MKRPKLSMVGWDFYRSVQGSASQLKIMVSESSGADLLRFKPKEHTGKPGAL